MASIEQYSEHPIAQAFVTDNTLNVSRVEVIINQGIIGEIAGETYRIGRAQFMPCGIPDHLVDATVLVSKNEEIIAAYWLTDALKTHTTDVISKLSQHYSLSIISGDAAKNVFDVAASLNITNAHHSCRPEDKLSILTNLQTDKNVVMMLGDGINDAPVLAQADVAITVGNAGFYQKYGYCFITRAPRTVTTAHSISQANETHN